MAGPYATVGARLVERGYVALPIIPGTKRPGHKVKGEWTGIYNWVDKWKDRPPTSWETLTWGRLSDAGVCVVAGPASKGLIAIDIDTDQTDIVKAIHAKLPQTTVRKKGAKGETLFFRCSAGLNPWNGVLSPSFDVPEVGRVCDVIGPGRQTVLPPTIHSVTGQAYQWTGPDALEDVDPYSLPEIVPNIGELMHDALKPFGHVAAPVRALKIVSGDIDSPHRLLNQEAYAKPEMWVPLLNLYRCKKKSNGYEAVPTWRPSGRNRSNHVRKLNLSITPMGIKDFGATGTGHRETYSPLDLVMAAADCDLDTAFKFIADALGWWNQPIELALTVPASTAVATVPAEAAPPKKKPDELAALTHVPGVVGDLIDWITATARRPNRVLALGAAVTIVGTLIGRRVAGPTGSATHLYVVTLAPTGSGKQHPINCTSRLMKAAGAGHHIGASQFLSMSAVIDFLAKKPLSLCTQDEFGAFLKRINNRKASTQEMGISGILRNVFGASWNDVQTPAWANKGSPVLSSIALSIHGLSVHNEFYGSLQEGDLTNGFLNRFLILSSELRAPEETPKQAPDEVPDALKSALEKLYNWDGTQLGTARLNDPTLDPKKEKLDWGSDAAEAVYKDMMLSLESDIDNYPGLEHFMGRTGEIALRLATIRAAGRYGKGGEVEVTDMEWGRDVATLCGRFLAVEAQKYMAVNERQDWANQIERLVERKGTASVRDIQQHIRSALKSPEVKDILGGLIESGTIEPIWKAFGGGSLQKIVAYKFVGKV